MLSDPSFKEKFVAAVLKEWKDAKKYRFLTSNQSNGRNSGAAFHLNKERPGGNKVQADVREQNEPDLLDMRGDDEGDEEAADLEAKYAAFGYDDFC